MCDFRRFMIFPTCLKSLLRELSSAVGETAYLCFPPRPLPIFTYVSEPPNFELYEEPRLPNWISEV